MGEKGKSKQSLTAIAERVASRYGAVQEDTDVITPDERDKDADLGNQRVGPAAPSPRVPTVPRVKEPHVPRPKKPKKP